MKFPKLHLSIILAVFFLSLNLKCQTKDSIRNVIAFLPSQAKLINGLALGLYNLPANFPDEQIVNGLNLELIGSGIKLVGFIFNEDDRLMVLVFPNTYVHNGVTLGTSLLTGKVNGLSASILVSGNRIMNGFSISTVNLTTEKANGLVIGSFNIIDQMNGVQCGLINTNGDLAGFQIGLLNSNIGLTTGLQIGLLNITDSLSKGIQIGLVNIASDHRGFQMGLWNKNAKRSLPFINWQFRLAKKKEEE